MRNRYWVVWKSALAKWQVTKTGNSSALRSYDTKEEAKAYAVEIAKRNQPSQVTLKKKDGTIELEWTYGNDPYPPIG